MKSMMPCVLSHRTPKTCFFFFFNDTATTEIYTLSLHDALPISAVRRVRRSDNRRGAEEESAERRKRHDGDRKSTRLNSSGYISYAVFCLKKKKKNKQHRTARDSHLFPSCCI